MDSSFWQSAYAGAGAASAEYNLDLVCEGPDGDGEEDYEAQNEMIDRAIREQVDALLFSAIDFEKNAEAIDRAAKAGIRIVVVDSPVNRLWNAILVQTIMKPDVWQEKKCLVIRRKI